MQEIWRGFRGLQVAALCVSQARSGQWAGARLVIPLAAFYFLKIARERQPFGGLYRGECEHFQERHARDFSGLVPWSRLIRCEGLQSTEGSSVRCGPANFWADL